MYRDCQNRAVRKTWKWKGFTEATRENCIQKKAHLRKKTGVFGEVGDGGGDESRTRVQTYSAKAFYMLILFCVFGNGLEPNNRPIP